MFIIDSPIYSSIIVKDQHYNATIRIPKTRIERIMEYEEGFHFRTHTTSKHKPSSTLS